VSYTVAQGTVGLNTDGRGAEVTWSEVVSSSRRPWRSGAGNTTAANRLVDELVRHG
jgi:hypothetical protein